MAQLMVTAHTPHPGEPHPADCIKFHNWRCPATMLEGHLWETVNAIITAEVVRMTREMRDFGVPVADMHWEMAHYYVDLEETRDDNTH